MGGKLFCPHGWIAIHRPTPIAAVSVTLPGLLQGKQHLLINSSSPFFRIHLLVAMLAYSLFTLELLMPG